MKKLILYKMNYDYSNILYSEIILCTDTELQMFNNKQNFYNGEINILNKTFKILNNQDLNLTGKAIRFFKWKLVNTNRNYLEKLIYYKILLKFPSSNNILDENLLNVLKYDLNLFCRNDYLCLLIIKIFVHLINEHNIEVFMKLEIFSSLIMYKSWKRNDMRDLIIDLINYLKYSLTFKRIRKNFHEYEILNNLKNHECILPIIQNELKNLYEIN